MTDLDIIKECRQTGRTRTTTKNLLQKAYYEQMTEIQKTEGEIKVLQAKLELLKEMEKHKTPCEIAYRDWWGEYPTTTWRNDIDRWNAFEKGYNASKVTEVEPSMINCVLLGNPPDGYVTWNEWYNEMGSKGILHNLKISAKEYHLGYNDGISEVNEVLSE